MMAKRKKILMNWNESVLIHYAYLSFNFYYFMKNSPVKNLVDHLKNVYSLPKKPSHEMQKPDEESLKEEMSKHYRNPWKTNGIVHDSYNVPRRPIGELDNWEILRIHMV